MPTGIYDRTKAKPNPGLFSKGHDGHKSWQGKKFSDDHREKLAEAKRGKIMEQHNGWKGDEVSYSGMHRWLYRNLGQPDACEHCGKSGLSGRFIHWANKSHEYKRDITDWLRLCAKCHKAYDRKEQF